MDFHVPVEYLPNAEFETTDSSELMFLSGASSIYTEDSETGNLGFSSSGDYELLQDHPLLSAAGERFLFRKMNFLKHVAEKLRKSTMSNRTAADCERILSLLEDAGCVRNHIANCNMRLVISVARKFATGTTDFDELMSEGNEILLKAIEKFDYDRGFRFSTYAVNSIQRHYFRYLQRIRRREQMVRPTADEIICDIPESEADELIGEWIREEGRVTVLIQRMAEALDEREERIIRDRFGLGGDKPKSLRDLAAELNLSKERVRQLQISAIERLRELHESIPPLAD